MTPFTRRRALITGGTAGIGALLPACTTRDLPPPGAGPQTTGAEIPMGTDPLEALSKAGTCALTPQATEGPYHLDVDSVRSDIRDDRPGARLVVALRVLGLPSCSPVPDAVVEIWHADAGGVYSGFETAKEERFLRGSQVTDADGVVRFMTVYPGWYRGRTVHIHLKVRLRDATLLTSQLYFDEKVNARVHQNAPYTSHPGRDRFNGDDGLFDQRLVMTTVIDGDGYLAALNLGVNSP